MFSSCNKILTISITKEGKYFLEETEMNGEELRIHLDKISQENPNQKIHLRADNMVHYGAVSRVLAIDQNKNLHNISFITQN